MIQIRDKQSAPPSFIPDFTDPLGLLVACHGKIEAHLRSMERAARVLQQGDVAASAAAFSAIAAAQSHFAGPGVKHTADEEESLFPRLRAYSVSDEALLDAMDELEAEHRVVERAHAEFDVLADTLARGGTPASRTVEELEHCVDALVSMYGPHILLENEVIFPAAARALPPDELLAVGQEMRGRRVGMLRAMSSHHPST